MSPAADRGGRAVGGVRMGQGTNKGYCRKAGARMGGDDVEGMLGSGLENVEGLWMSQGDGGTCGVAGWRGGCRQTAA